MKDPRHMNVWMRLYADPPHKEKSPGNCQARGAKRSNRQGYDGKGGAGERFDTFPFTRLQSRIQAEMERGAYDAAAMLAAVHNRRWMRLVRAGGAV